jgi:cytochrome c peroxidase
MRIPWLLLSLTCILVALAAGSLHRPAAGTAPGQARAPLGPRAELGRYLFYDRRLSADGRGACAACHRPEFAFSDGLPTARTSAGASLPRNTPGLLNVGSLPAFGWADPRVRTLVAQVARPLFATHPVELGVAGNEARVLGRFAADPAYARRFAAAFPDDPAPLRWERVVEALAAFTAALSAVDSPYDRALARPADSPLPAAALRGRALFFSPGLACAHCHRDLSAPAGAPAPEAAYIATGAGRSPDRGLAELSGDPADAYRFRVPPLRNVALTAPYMHDGSLPSLEAVIRFYESGGRAGAGPEPDRAAARHPLVAGFALSDAERQDLIAFLSALSDQAALRDPAFADPFAVHSSIPVNR